MLAALPFAVLAVAITVFLGRSVAIPGTPAAVVHLGVSAVIQTAILILFVAITSRLFQMLASRIVGQVRGQAPALAAALTQSEHKDKRFAPARAELRSHSAVKARMKGSELREVRCGCSEPLADIFYDMRSDNTSCSHRQSSSIPRIAVRKLNDLFWH